MCIIYPVLPGEMFAILYWTNRYSFYLLHRHFLLRTDCKAWSFYKTMDKKPAIVDSWMHQLNDYSFDIEHRFLKYTNIQ